jgi:hypothetical protein
MNLFSLLRQLMGFTFFVLVLSFSVFVPGWLILSWARLKLTVVEKIGLSAACGIVFLTLLGFVLGFLGLRSLILPLLIFLTFIFFVQRFFKPLLKFKIKSFEKLGLLAALMGGGVYSLVMVKSGLPCDSGLGFWGVHGHDGIWHLTLISEIASHFPPQNPGFAGFRLQNYHYFFDLFVAQLCRISHLNSLDLYFRFVPLVFGTTLALLVFLLASRLSRNWGVGLLAIFLTSATGSFGFIPPIFSLGSSNWETAFWGMQSPSAFLNPPFAFSLIVSLTAVFLVWLILVDGQKSKIIILVTGIIFGSLIEFKVYGGLIFLAALFITGFLQLLLGKEKTLLKIFLTAAITSFVIFIPTSVKATGFLIFEPWWFVRTMVVAPDRLNWVELELKRQTFAYFGNLKAVLIIESLAFFIFLLGNLGIRSLGFLALLGRLKGIKLFDLFLILLLLTSLLPPLLFLQKGTAWNTIQFFYYFIFFMSFLAAEAIFRIYEFLKVQPLKILFILIIVGFSLPTTLKTAWNFLAPTPTSFVSAGELEGLNFLKKTTPKEAVILTYPFQEGTQGLLSPILLSNQDSPYVSFFSQRQVFLEDQDAATILGYPVEERCNEEKEFFTTTDANLAGKFLAENNISYIYLGSEEKFNFPENTPFLEKVFDNEKVRIYQVSGKI